MKEYDQKGKYLGLPFCNFKSKTTAFGAVVEKLENKLSGWKSKALSMAGRMILIKSITLEILMYLMQTFQLPKAMLRQIDRRNKNFLWNFKGDTRKHLHLKSWKAICTPKENSGLGMTLFTDLNKALLTKLA